jgi:hypothetical protein
MKHEAIEEYIYKKKLLSFSLFFKMFFMVNTFSTALIHKGGIFLSTIHKGDIFLSIMAKLPKLSISPE